MLTKFVFQPGDAGKIERKRGMEGGETVLFCTQIDIVRYELFFFFFGEDQKKKEKTFRLVLEKTSCLRIQSASGYLLTFPTLPTRRVFILREGYG